MLASRSILILHPEKAIQEKTLQKIITRENLGSLENQVNVFKLEEEKDLNIAKTRQIKSFLSQKSFQNQPRLVIIHQAHLLRPPAQNALLKTLEDPPLGTYIFLLASQKDFFLPTILSRCQIIKVAPTPPVVSSSLLAPLISQDDSQRLAFSQTEAKKLDPKNFIQTELSFWQTKINPSAPRLSGKIIKALLQAQKILSTNVSWPFVLDWLLLSLPFSSSLPFSAQSSQKSKKKVK